MNDTGTVGAVAPGELLGPIVGLTFSSGGDILFASCGSSVRAYSVGSGKLLVSRRVFPSGVAVSGLDIGDEGLTGAVFGDKSILIVNGVVLPSLFNFSWTGATGKIARDGPCQSWFQTVARIPPLDDRVWDARLIQCGDIYPAIKGEKGKGKGESRKMRLVAAALAHNCVEVWQWNNVEGPVRMSRSRAGDPCLLYHARLWGRTLGELRVAAGTVFNQILVWSPADTLALFADQRQGKRTDLDVRGQWQRNGGADQIRSGRNLLRLQAHEGVLFRISWREDGKRIASASDDRTVRVWNVVDEHDGSLSLPSNVTHSCTCDFISKGCDGTCDITTDSNQSVGIGDPARVSTSGWEKVERKSRLLWTGWGHLTRVWDVGFSREGVISAGEDGSAILWRERYASATSDSSADVYFPTAVVPTDKIEENRADQTGERQMLPATTMRGHSGSHVWRLAVHENNGHQMSLMATGGNDGAIKLWDLAYEAARQEASRSGKISWGQTNIIPTLSALHPPCSTAPVGVAAAKPSYFNAAAANERHNKPGPNCGCRRQRQRPAVVRELHLSRSGMAAALLLADGSVWWVSDLAAGSWVKVTEASDLGKHAAVVLKGSVEDNSAGYGQQGEMPQRGTGKDPRRTEHGCFQGENETEGVTWDGRLLSKGVSAITVVGCFGIQDTPGAGESSQECCGGVAGVEDVSEFGDTSSCGASIVVGRDDGWLFILTQQQLSSSVPVVDGERYRTEEAPIPTLWRVSEQWKGHKARVTSLWPAVCRASTSSGEGDNMLFDALPSHTAALDTSRLRTCCHGNSNRHGFNGDLVSAAADGTVGWWAWPRDHCCGSSSAARKEQRTPPVRILCRAGPAATITSFVIDDTHGRIISCSERRNNDRLSSPSNPRTATGQDMGDRTYHEWNAAGASVFCGDTKGNIYCFLNPIEEHNDADGTSMESPTHGGKDGRRETDLEIKPRAAEAIAPCLVLRRQHGKDQISRLALMGDCLLSAGHDGHVNHYLVSYHSHDTTDEAPTDPLPRLVLTLVTSYPTSPVNVISDLWVGGYCNGGGYRPDCSGGRQSKDSSPQRTSRDALRIVVAGRSGSKFMSVWDVTEGRQLLELECGDRHLAQALLLSWPSALSARSRTPVVPGDSFSSGRPRIHTSFRSRGCRGAAVTLLPRHTAVFTRPVSATALTTRNDDHRIVGCRNGTEVAAEGRSSSPCNAEELWTGKAKRKPHPGARERPPVGIRLAFHSTLVSPQGQETPSVRGARRESCGMPEGSTGEDATATAQSSASRGHREEATRESSRLRSFSTSSANIAQATKRRERAESEHVEWKPSAFDGKSSAREHVSPPPPLQAYAYSIGGAFHNQRVASVRFLPGVEKCTARMGSKDDRQRTGMHLVTGGEDGVVKLLDVLCSSSSISNNNSSSSSNNNPTVGQQQHHHQLEAALQTASSTSGGRTATNGLPPPPSSYTLPGACRMPLQYATTVTQTLPPHESSIGAIAIEIPGDTIYARGEPPRLVIVSGGGKMELRVWSFAGSAQKGEQASTSSAFEGDEHGGAPLVRWLLTTTPTPGSTLHAHRIMCLCVLSRRPPSQADIRGGGGGGGGGGHSMGSGVGKDVLVVAGDSSGGLSVFSIHNVEINAAGDRGDGGGGGRGVREPRLFPVGRWMNGGRPVLCVVHTRLTTIQLPRTSKPPPTSELKTYLSAVAADLVVTGDTGGTVTVWQLVAAARDSSVVHDGSITAGGEEHRSRGCGQKAHAEVVDGFVYRGPAGRRRGAAEGAEGENGACLVPLLEYRAHQSGVFCAAVQVAAVGERLLIVTGGDDQAVCVAEVEVLWPEDIFDSSDSDKDSRNAGVEPKFRSGGCDRLVTARLIEAAPEIIKEASGSAIKGIALLPPIRQARPADTASTTSPSAAAATAPATTTTTSSPRAPDTTLGADERSAGIPRSTTMQGSAQLVATIFTLSRDQRLSRWELSEHPQPSGDEQLAVGSGDFYPCRGNFEKTFLKSRGGRGKLEQRVSEMGTSRVEVEVNVQKCLGQGQERFVGANTISSAAHHGDGWSNKILQRRHRWQLLWKAGCVTDVCDVSSMDVIILPVHEQHGWTDSDQAGTATGISPTAQHSIVENLRTPDHGGQAVANRDVYLQSALVAVAGQGLQLVLFDGVG